MKKRLLFWVFPFFLLAPFSVSAQWSSNPQLNNPVCTAANNQSFPKGVSDGNGGVIICWQDNRSGNGSYGDIYAQHIDKNGVDLWTADGIPVSITGTQAEHPKITSDGNGGAIIAWVDHRYQGVNGNSSETDIFAQRLDGNGNIRWQVNGVPVDSTAYSKENIAIIGDGNGGAFLTWDEFWQSNYEAIFAQHINSDGNIRWGSLNFPIKISYETSGVYAYEPQMTSDEKGGFIVTWYDDRNYYQDNIYAQRVDSSGNRLWSSTDVAVCGADYGEEFPQIISNGRKGAIITWDDNRSGGSYNTSWDVYAQDLDSNGNKLWLSATDPYYANNGIPICTAAYRQFFPQIVSDGNMGAYIAWTDERNGGSGGLERLYVQHVSQAGDTTMALNGLEVDTVQYDGNALFEGLVSPPALLLSSGNAVLVSWRTPTGNALYGQKIDSTGAFQWGAVPAVICNAPNTGPVNNQLISDGAGGGIAFWSDSRNIGVSGQDIYASLLNTSGTLPVRLLGFSGSYTGKEVLLRWQAVNEQNVQAYIVARSIDGRNFQTLGTVKASTNAGSTKDYSFTDVSVPAGVYYYRLKILDNDQTASFSGVIRVAIHSSAGLQIYPNPVSGNLQVNLPARFNGYNLETSIYSPAGNLLGEDNFKNCRTSIRLATGQLSAGVYFLELRFSDGTKETLKFFKN